jgi:hypothetical protein
MSSAGTDPTAGDAAPEAESEALRRAMDRALFERRGEGAYASPWWASPVDGTHPGVRAWKAAVLCRRPEGGAEHWGHVFVVLGPSGSPGSPRLTPESFLGARHSEGPIDRWEVLMPARSGWVVARARTERFARDLFPLAKRLAEELTAAGRSG